MVRIDRTRRIGAAAALLPLFVTIPGRAQDAPPPPPPAAAQDAAATDDTRIAEVVVTAQRREEKLQEVPLAVTAMGAEQIDTRGIQNVGDLSALAPGLQISKTASNSTISQITIRGLSQINPAIYWDPAVGVYVDGVYIGKAQGGIFDVVDLEREVLGLVDGQRQSVVVDIFDRDVGVRRVGADRRVRETSDVHCVAGVRDLALVVAVYHARCGVNQRLLQRDQKLRRPDLGDEVGDCHDSLAPWLFLAEEIP